MNVLTASVLAIDASTDGCSVALTYSGQLFQQQSLEARSHAQNLLPMVSQCLDAAGVSLSDLDAIAVTLGPGSFTGVRIGLSVAQGLAFGAGLPLIGKNSLEVMAVAALHDDTNATVVTCLDARMSEVYWAAYAMSGGVMTERARPAVCSPETFNTAVTGLNAGSSSTLHGVGHGFSIESVFRDLFSLCEPGALPHARDILRLLSDDDVHAAKSGSLNYAIEPLYLRNEVAWEKRTRIRQHAPNTSAS